MSHSTKPSIKSSTSDQHHDSVDDDPDHPVTDIDTILNRIKPFGRYQFLTAFIYCYAYLQGMLNNLFMAYGGIIPKWRCSNLDVYNSTSSITPGDVTSDCNVYHQCPKENLTFVAEFHSIVVEWSLVCDQDYLVGLIPTIQMIGLLIGALTMGPLSDMFGRKWTFVALLIAEYSIGALSALAPNATVFIVFRFFIGWCIGAENVIGWVFAAELTTNRYRLLVRIMAGVLVPVWNQTLIAYLTQNWKWYSIVGNLEGLPIIPVLIIFTYESPRWLAQKGRTDEAMRILRNIARINKCEHSFPKYVRLETEAPGHRKPQIWDLFRTRRLITYSLVSAGTWFAVSLADYGMYFNIGNLPLNVYLTNIILGCLYTLIIPLAICDAYFPGINRKYIMVVLFSIAAVCNYLVAILESVLDDKDPAKPIALTLCSTIGLLCCETVFDTAYVYSVELFPTLLRSNAGGLSSVSARVGGAIAPQLLYAGRDHWPPLPYVIFGSICVFGAIIDGLALPNTKNMHLPETMEQTNRMKEGDNEEEDGDCDHERAAEGSEEDGSVIGEGKGGLEIVKY